MQGSTMDTEHHRDGAHLLPYVLLFGAIYVVLLIVVGALAELTGINSPAIDLAILATCATLVANRYVRKHHHYWDHREIMLFALGAVSIKSLCTLGFLFILPDVRIGVAIFVVAAFLGAVHWLVLYAFLRWPAKRLADKWLQVAEPQLGT